MPDTCFKPCRVSLEKWAYRPVSNEQFIEQHVKKNEIILQESWTQPRSQSLSTYRPIERERPWERGCPGHSWGWEPGLTYASQFTWHKLSSRVIRGFDFRDRFFYYKNWDIYHFQNLAGYIEYFMESVRVRCLQTSCGVSEIEQVSEANEWDFWYKTTSV